MLLLVNLEIYKLMLLIRIIKSMSSYDTKRRKNYFLKIYRENLKKNCYKLKRDFPFINFKKLFSFLN